MSIPEAERDERIKLVLTDPAQAGAAILAWAVAGAVEWQQQRLSVPSSVKTATSEYREAMDPLRDFLSACCVLEAEAWIAAEDLRAAYEKWARENGVRVPLNGKEFGKRLRARGCAPKKHGRDTRGWIGVRSRGLLDPDPIDPDDQAADGGHEATGDSEPDWVRE